jgi:hypothetical protein
MSTNNSNISLVEIEALENKYLSEYTGYLQWNRQLILNRLASREEIKSSWVDKPYSISQYNASCEHIIAGILRRKIATELIPAPFCTDCTDVFFEEDDAFIHIAIKSLTTDTKTVSTEYIEEYTPNLQPYYVKEDGTKKFTLTYLIYVLTNAATGKCELISMWCIPNKKLDAHPNRVSVIYANDEIARTVKSKELINSLLFVFYTFFNFLCNFPSKFYRYSISACLTINLSI